MAPFKLSVKDCMPFERQPNSKEAEWLKRLTANVRDGRHVLSLSGSREDEEPVVRCEWDGKWWAGRYVGSISFEGSTLVIKPRFGPETIRSWLKEATGFLVTDSPGRTTGGENYIAEWLAAVWAAGFVDAARHGLPALRQDRETRGPTLRGRLDLRGSLRSLSTDRQNLISVRTERTLDHSASEAIVAAYTVLSHLLGPANRAWLPPRVKELLPHLLAVTGRRPEPPTIEELQRIRYTPITEGFRSFAELSRQIANQRGFDMDLNVNGETKGMLLDVAELWELYVLNVLRKALPAFQVKHGTRERGFSESLLQSPSTQLGMGTLVPDAILFLNGEPCGVVDAKYKSLHPSWSAKDGPQREDLYQMAAYLRTFSPSGPASNWGILAYPQNADRPESSRAESGNPWLLQGGSRVLFTVLPHEIGAAAEKIARLVSPFIN